jgi:WD40 repeat protein
MTLETAREPAGLRQFNYDAFISYRHVDPDRVWAKWLHSALESYRVPRTLRRTKGLPPRIGRVFRDEEELPASEDLNAEIESALSQSRFLIVVCSPRATQSRWVNREIERFREMGRQGHILALLIEGEPVEAFPTALREIRYTVIDRGGSSQERIEEVEPLAADVRETRQESGRYLRRMAKLRILSCVLGVKFDDLRRREQERRARRLAYLGTVLAVLLLIVGGLAVYAFRQRNAAVQARGIAETQRRRAELELATGTVLQGDLLGSAGRWIEARDKYSSAATLFRQHAAAPLAADLGLWDASGHVSGPLSTLTGHTGFVRAVAISPDGRRALSGGDDHVLRLWDLLTARLVASLPGHTAAVRAIAFLPDGSQALSAGDDKVARLWDLAAGRELHAYKGDGAAINALAVIDQGRRFLTGDAAGKVLAWNVVDGTSSPVSDLGMSVACLAVSPDGHRALCGDSNGHARLLNLANGQTLQTFGTGGLPFTSVAFTPGGKSVLTCGLENECRIWDISGNAPGAAAAPGRSIKDPVSRFSYAVISPNGRALLTGNWLGQLESFNFDTGQVRRTFVGHAPGLVTQIAFSPDGRVAVSGSSDNSVKVWDLDGGAAHHSWGYGAAVEGVGFSSDGRLAFTATGSGRMELWDIGTEQTLYTARLPETNIFTALLCPDGHHALAACITSKGENIAALCDLTGATPTVRLEGHQGLILGLAVSPDGKTALASSYDNTVRVWDLAGGRELHSISPGQRVSAAAFSADGRRALTVSLEGMRLWDTADWHAIRSIGAAATGLVDAFESAAFSPDGQWILAGTQAGTLKLFDPNTGRELRAFAAAHTGIVGAVAFSPDGRLAASGSDDHTVRLWDVATGGELRILSGHEGSIRELAFSPDGQSLLTGGLDRSLKLWNFGSTAIEAETSVAVDAARSAAEKSPADPVLASALLTARGKEYAQHGLDGWAIALLEQARAGGAAVSPLLMGRCYWRLGRLRLAHAELARALDQKEAPAEYLGMCLKAIDAAGGGASAASMPTTGPASRP